MRVSFIYLLIATIIGNAYGGLFSSKGRKIADIPNPMKDPLACGRADVAKSAVCDPDNKLSKDSKNEIEGYINAITHAQVAIAVIEQMDIASVSTSSDIDFSAKKFATTLHDNWGVGSSETNDGILVFLSIKDRAIYISTGSGVQKQVSYTATQDIINDMKPYLKRADYGAAVATCVIELDLYLSGKGSQIHSRYNKSRATAGSGSTSDGFEIGVSFVLFAGVVIWAVIAQRRRDQQMRGFERGRVALESLMRDVDNTEENNRFFTSSCPICLEEFPKTASVVSVETNEVVEPSAPPEPTLTVPESVYNPDDKDSDSEEPGAEETSPILPSAPPVPVPPTPSPHGNMQPKALRCGHTFCAGCLESLLRNTNNNKCPICRAPVDGDLSGPDSRSDGTPHRPFFSSGGGGTDGSGGGGSSSSTGDGPSGDSGSRPSCAESFRSDDLPTYDYQQESSSSSSTYSSSTRSFTSTSFVRRAPEIRFRLNRMRHLYPDVMTVEMLRLMNSSVDRGSIHDFRSHIQQRSVEVTRMVADIREAAAKAARSSGRGGSSGGFGGGRSSGGGGGRW